VYCYFSYYPDLQKRRPGNAAAVHVYLAKPVLCPLHRQSEEVEEPLCDRSSTAIFSKYLERVCSHPCLFELKHTKNARALLGPEYIQKVALKAMAEAGIDTAEWKAHSSRGAAATHFMAKGVPGAVVQARGGWASASTMATHYAVQHQLIPLTELASSPPDLASGAGNVASSSSVLPRASLQSFSSTSVRYENRDLYWMVQIVRDEG